MLTRKKNSLIKERYEHFVISEVYTPNKQNSKSKPRMQTRSKLRVEQSAQKDMDASTELYPRSVIENASSHLKEVIDGQNGIGWNKLKRKCGIFPENGNNGNEKGWGYPSHFFSLTGLPEEYLGELSADLGLSGFAAYAETTSKSPGKSAPTATVTFAESSNGEELTDTGDLNTDDIEPVLMENTVLESCVTAAEGIRAENNDDTVANEDEFKDTSVDAMQGLKRKRESLETEEIATEEIVDNLLVSVKSSDLDNTVDRNANTEKRTVKKLRQENCVNESVDKETGNVEQIDNESLDIQMLSSMESSDETAEVGNGNVTASQRENLIDDLDKGVSTGVVMSTSQGDTYRFKCDFCPAVSSYEERILKHLETAMHYSASLVSVDGMGIPEHTVWQCIFTYDPATFKTVVAICPYLNCPNIFRHMYSCAAHYNIYHKPEEGPVYGLAEVVNEDRITSYNLYKKCKVCSAEFPNHKDLTAHMVSECHRPYKREEKTETIFLCTVCERSFHKFFVALNHAQVKKGHLGGIRGDIRVLHISLNRIKKTILPYKLTPDLNLALINSEINNLKEIKRHAGKCARKRINKKLQEMKRLKEDPNRLKQSLYFQPTLRSTNKRENLRSSNKQANMDYRYANLIASLRK